MAAYDFFNQGPFGSFNRTQKRGVLPSKDKNFGAPYFLLLLLHSNGFLTLLQSLPLSEKDKESLISFLFYLTLSNPGGRGSSEWLKDNILKAVFPKADLGGKNLRALFNQIEEPAFQQTFFKEYLAWVEKSYGTETNILVGVDMHLGYYPSFIDEMYMFARKQDNEPLPFELLFVLQKKSGLPLYFHKGKSQILAGNDLETALKECKEIGLTIKESVLMQYGWSLKDSQAFYGAKHQPLFNYVVLIKEPAVTELKKLFGKEIDEEKSIEPDKAIIYNEAYFQPWQTKTNLLEDEKEDPAWYTYYSPLGFVRDGIEAQEESIYNEEDTWQMDGFTLLSNKEHKPEALLKKLNVPKARKFVKQLDDKLIFHFFPGKDTGGALFCLFVAEVINRIIKKAFYKAGLKGNRFLDELNQAACRMNKNQIEVQPPTALDQTYFDALGFIWPKRLRLKKGCLDLESIFSQSLPEREKSDNEPSLAEKSVNELEKK